MHNPFKKKNNARQMKCPKCGGKMTMTSGLTRTLHCRGRDIEVSDIAGMLCADCGEVMLDWLEVQRIKKYVNEAVGWKDPEQ